nr:hypothetical protein BaRGS_001385 [Batillaria attramentaria]
MKEREGERRVVVEVGQEFVNGTARCLTRGLLQYYKQDKVDCHRLSHDAFDLVSSCYASNGFCDVAEENAAVFTDVFQPKYLFKSGALKIWKEIMELMYHCNPDKVHNLATTVVKMPQTYFGGLELKKHTNRSAQSEDTVPRAML